MPLRIFPEIILSQTEVDIISNRLSDPVVKKYFHKMAYETSQNIILSEPDLNESPESYLRRVATVKGRLEAFNTLLSIDPIAAPLV